MAIVTCQNGHFYDNEKFGECPHCAGPGTETQDSVTVAMAQQSREVERYAMEYLKRSAPQTHVKISVQEDEEKTVGLYQKRGMEKCTAGWLVCIAGEAYGRDFPLYAGFNRIGRGSGNDIRLNDNQVSRDEHCSVVYEEKKNVFYLTPKGGNLTYVGEEMVHQAQQIAGGDVITVGQTQLELAVFCTGDKKWAKKE